MSLRCTLLGHRPRLTYTADACVLRCQRCGHDERVGDALRPEVRHQQDREARWRAAEDARIVAKREAMAAAMSARQTRTLKLVRNA